MLWSLILATHCRFASIPPDYVVLPVKIGDSLQSRCIHVIKHGGIQFSIGQFFVSLGEPKL